MNQCFPFSEKRKKGKEKVFSAISQSMIKNTNG